MTGILKTKEAHLNGFKYWLLKEEKAILVPIKKEKLLKRLRVFLILLQKTHQAEQIFLIECASHEPYKKEDV